MYLLDVKKLKIIRYRRKSTESEDRQIASLHDQDTNLDELEKRLKIKPSQIVANFGESHSAKKSGTRPDFKEAIRLVRLGQANAIESWHADRLSRNIGDVSSLVELIESGKLTAVITPQYLYGNTPRDKYELASECLRAKLDNDEKGVNVKRGHAGKVVAGWRPGPAKPGYLNDTTKEIGERTIISDPERFRQVRRIFDLALTGKYSLSQITDIAENKWKLRTRKTKKMGGKPLCKSHIHHILTDPFYYGWFWWKNKDTGIRELVKGKHRAMITIAEFDRIQILLGRSGKQRPKDRTFAYRGMISCGECGSAVTAEEKNQLICTCCKYKFSYENKFECPKCQKETSKMQDPTTLRYVYYRCTKKKKIRCAQKYVRVENLEKQIGEELEKLEINPTELKLTLEYLNKIKAQEIRDTEGIKKAFREAHEDIQKRLERLNHEYTSGQNVDYSIYSPEEFRELKANLLQEREKIEKQIKQLETGVDKTLALSEDTFNFCAYAWVHFKNGSFEEKKSILSALGSNLTLIDGKLNIEAYKPYLIIKNTLSYVRAEKVRLEPRKSVATKAQSDHSGVGLIKLLGGMDDVRTWIRENQSWFTVPKLTPIPQK